MNLKKRKQVSKLKSFIFSNVSENAVHGSIKAIDNGVFIDVDGIFKMLQIAYNGEPFINNLLPDGYSINMNQNRIVILNLLNKPIDKDRPIFSYSGEFFVNSASIINLKGENIILTRVNYDKMVNIDENNTKPEDDSLIIRDEGHKIPVSSTSGAGKRGINNRTIKGLYRTTPFENGYTGYYNYDPKTKTYITGKTMGANSKIKRTTKVNNTSPKSIRNLKNFLIKNDNRGSGAKILGGDSTQKPTQVRAITQKAKQTTKKKEIKTTNGGKY